MTLEFRGGPAGDIPAAGLGLVRLYPGRDPALWPWERPEKPAAAVIVRWAGK